MAFTRRGKLVVAGGVFVAVLGGALLGYSWYAAVIGIGLRRGVERIVDQLDQLVPEE